MGKRLALIGIVVEDLSVTEQLNHILHEYGNYIIGRMGVPYHDRGVCVISVIIDAENDVISSLSGKLGKFHDVSVKTVYQKVR